MFTYTPKNMSLATDFVMAARYLATTGTKAKLKGGKLITAASPAQVSQAIKDGYAKFGF